jgi:hypothetical protein
MLGALRTLGRVGREAVSCTTGSEEDAVIPTMILVGVVLGRWWKVALVVAALGWPLLLVVTGLMGVEPGLLVASALAVVNAGVGVLAHQGVLHVYRSARAA